MDTNALKSIKEARTIDEIREFRASLHKSRMENDDNSLSLLGDLYKDDTHFIYELLQNAEDAGATSAIFHLTENSLNLGHNGKEFTLEDVKAITNYGASEKIAEEKIGKFGIGFKSVFSITDAPQIHSGEYSFTIENYSVPRAIESRDRWDGETVFVFEYKNDKPCYQILKDRFLSLELESLMFLRKIQKIDVFGLGDQSYTITKNVQGTSLVIKKERIDDNLQVIPNGLVEQKNFLYFASKSQVRSAFDVSIAFVLDHQGKIVSDGTKNLNVFFPTEIDTGLNFYVNAPFETKPTREQLKQKSETNIALMKELVVLYTNALSWIADNHLSSVEFLELLPIRTSQHTANPIYKFLDYLVGNDYYKEFWKGTHKALQHLALVPTHNGQFCSASRVAIAKTNELLQLVDDEICHIVANRESFANAKLSTQEHTKLVKYLQQEHIVPIIEFTDFLAKLDNYLLSTKTDEWLIALYKECIANPSTIHNECLLVPLIRTKSNKQVVFTLQPLPNVYLPSTMLADDKQVKPIFVQNPVSAEFLNRLGIQEAAVTETVASVILPQLQKIVASTNFDKQAYLQIWETLCNIYKSISGTDQVSALVRLLINQPIMLCNSPTNSQPVFACPQDCLAFNPKNTLLYEYTNGLVVSDQFLQLGDIVQEFFATIGVKDKFLYNTIVYNDNVKTTDILTIVPEIQNASNILIKDFEIQGFHNFTKDNSYPKSFALLEYIIASNDCYSKLNSVVEYTLGTENKTAILGKSKLVKDIETFIFVTKENETIQISNTSKVDFYEAMGIQVEARDESHLLQALAFKRDARVSLNDDEIRKLELTAGLSVEDLLQLSRLHNNPNLSKLDIIQELNTDELIELKKLRSNPNLNKLSLVEGLSEQELQELRNLRNNPNISKLQFIDGVDIDELNELRRLKNNPNIKKLELIESISAEVLANMVKVYTEQQQAIQDYKNAGNIANTLSSPDFQTLVNSTTRADNLHTSYRNISQSAIPTSQNLDNINPLDIVQSPQKNISADSCLYTNVGQVLTITTNAENKLATMMYSHLSKSMSNIPNLEFFAKSLNSNDCDIEVYLNKILVEYITVRTVDPQNDINISGTNWDMAKSYCDNPINNPNLTLCLLQVNGNTAKIVFVGNPYYEWQNNNLNISNISINQATTPSHS